MTPQNTTLENDFFEYDLNTSSSNMTPKITEIEAKWWWDMKNENRTLNGTLLIGINSTVKNKFVTRHKQKYEYIVSRKRESNCGQSSWNQVSLKIISKKFQKFVKSSTKFKREILCEKFREISENFEIQLDYAVMSLTADSLFEQVKKLGRKKIS